MARDLEDWLATTGQRATARDVGALIAPAFEVERGRVRAVIESQLSDLRWTGVSARVVEEDLPSLDLPPGALQLRELGTPARGAPILAAPSSTTSFAPTDSGAAVPMASARTGTGTRSLAVPALVAGLASLAVVIVGLRVFVRPQSDLAPAAPPVTSAAIPSPAVATATGAPATTGTALPEAVMLTVTGTPPGVRVYLDGVLLSAGPFAGKVMRSTKSRTVRVEAQGYLPKEQEIALGADVVFTYDLAKADAPKPVVGGRSDRGKAKHDIDSDSPYKR
jgi:serine/threonine-protein kinase